MTENSKPIERKLLYQTIEFSVGEDGMLCNPYNKPLRNIIYEIAKEFSRKTQECEELNKTITNLENIRDEFSTKLDQLKHTLTEIREIAEENIRIADLEGLNGVYRRGLAKQILQKSVR